MDRVLHNVDSMGRQWKPINNLRSNTQRRSTDGVCLW